MSRWGRELEIARSAALAAGTILLAGRSDPGGQEVKSDGSPVTAADRDANAAILSRLGAAFPGDPVLSEESADDLARLARPRLWVVDPLDGTRDFLEGSPEFAVHVALVEGGEPVVGVVFEPASGRLLEAVAGEGAWRVDGGPRRPVSVSGTRELEEFRVGVSRFAQNGALKAMIAETMPGRIVVPRGASTKLLDLAEGLIEATVCLHGRECEWDTCAPGLIVTEAGGRVTDIDGRELSYNQPDTHHLRGVIASNGLAHDALCETAGRYWGRDG
jgi:3'(2'), 5'-bisphosphate nucleotidase